MSFVSEVISGLAGGGFGAITGLLGVGLQQWGEAKKCEYELQVMDKQFQQTVELKKSDDELQLKLAQQSAEVQERLATQATEARVAEMSSNDLSASYKHDTASYSTEESRTKNPWVAFMMGLVDFMRGIIRPGATIYCLILNTLLLQWFWSMVEQTKITLNPDLISRLSVEIVFSTTYLISVSLTWWFGSRPMTRK